MYAKDYPRALDYFRLDAGSGYQKRLEGLVRLRQGDEAGSRNLMQEGAVAIGPSSSPIRAPIATASPPNSRPRA